MTFTFRMEENVVIYGKICEILPRVDPDNGLEKPIGRSGHCCVADESNLYVFGGYNPRAGPLMTGQGAAIYFTPARQVMAELWVYNFASRTWKKIDRPGTPQAAASSCMRLIGKRLFVYGGTVFPFGHLMSNSLHVCDLSKDYKWETIEPVSLSDQSPPKAYGQSIEFHDRYMYTFGGAISFYMEPVNDLHRLNLDLAPGTRQWESLPPCGDVPKGRYKQEVVAYNDRLIVLGGGHLAGAEDLDKLHTYCIAKNEWSVVETRPDPEHGIPRPRSCFGCVRRGSTVIVCGGRHYEAALSTCNEGIEDMWTLKLDTLSWKRLNVDLPKATYFQGVALSPTGTMYIYGGIVDGETRTSDLYSLQVFFPRLVELCWKKVTECIPDILSLPVDELINIGIPHTFLKRIKY